MERLAGVKAALGNAEEGVGSLRALPETSDALIADAQDQRAMARQRAPETLAAYWTPGTGVIAPNDAVAEEFMEAAQERGLVAGRDYGLVGFDDCARDRVLTSLRPPLAELGEEAARLALRLLRGEPAPARIALQHRLMARASTAPMRTEGG